MKCPNDQSEMEKGELISEGGVWWANEGTILGFSGEGLTAYKCLECGKIELTTKKKEDQS